jgi:hypothetical protein
MPIFELQASGDPLITLSRVGSFRAGRLETYMCELIGRRELLRGGRPLNIGPRLAGNRYGVGLDRSRRRTHLPTTGRFRTIRITVRHPGHSSDWIS